MEKQELLPALVKIHSDVESLCKKGAFDEARSLIAVDPERFLSVAAKRAEIDTTKSPYYKRRVLDDAQGYLPRFLRLAEALIKVLPFRVVADLGRVTGEPSLELRFARRR